MRSPIFLFVVKAAALMPSLLQTSTLWRPMLPVEPRITVLPIILPPHARSRNSKSIYAGATNSTLSNLSSTPPWPGKIAP